MSLTANNPFIPIPDLNVLFQNKKYEVKTEINCIAIGTVVSFDTTDQTVTVQVNYLRVVYGGVAAGTDGTDSSGNQTQQYPQILKCPVMIATGGNSYLTFPIVAGDQCVILFNDRDIDTWWSTGSPNSPPNSNRVHDLNDALVFVGVYPKTSSLTQYNTLGPQLTNGDAFLSIEDKIKLSVNLVTLRQGLDATLTQCIALATATGNPSIATAFEAAQVLIDEVLK